MQGLFDESPDPIPTRVLVWFSCGVTSAVAARLTIQDYPNAEIVRILLDGEHADSDRFADDVAKWLGKPIIAIRGKFNHHLDAIRYHRYVNGPTGAKCTKDIKRWAREQYQQASDLHVFGFDAEEAERVDDFRENNPGLWFKAPLVEAGLTKSDAKAIVERAGIVLPEMYRLGYANNNCVGCVKGGMGYWNRIRIDFPAVFAETAKVEREVGATCLKRNGEKLYLDMLEPDAGRFETDQPSECGPLCQVALDRVGLGAN